ncbi:hypothetical protein GCM10027418_04600 [Mariniluteicoccus endophyticus]
MTALSVRLVGLIRLVAENLSASDREALVAQADAATVIAEISGRSVDVDVSHDLPAISLPNGPVHPVPAVVVDGKLCGELIVWVRGGRLIGVEQPWFGDEPPTEWPEVASLDFA